MKAIRFAQYGEPAQVLTVQECPLPEPGKGEVRVRMLSVLSPSTRSAPPSRKQKRQAGRGKSSSSPTEVRCIQVRNRSQKRGFVETISTAEGDNHLCLRVRKSGYFKLPAPPRWLSPEFSHPALPSLSIPIVAFWEVLDRYIFDKHSIENLQ